MQRGFYLALGIGLALSIAYAEDKPKSAQVQRGRELFLSTPKGIACGTCHQLGGVGTAIAPDLTDMAKYVPPRGIVSTMHTSMTEFVMEVTTAEGTFPGIVKQKGAESIEIWDLSKIPPVLNTLTPQQITKMTRDQKWKHPPSVTEYGSQELADIIGFLKWAATGAEKEVKVADVE